MLFNTLILNDNLFSGMTSNTAPGNPFYLPMFCGPHFDWPALRCADDAA